MIWPDGRDFAFTIIDDTDEATVDTVKPIYDYLYRKGLLTTKTVWAYPTRDRVGGQSLSDPEYRAFIKELSARGFEIASHGAGSGIFTREEVLSARALMRETVGYDSRIFINHFVNADNIYWGSERFSPMFHRLYNLSRQLRGRKPVFSGGSDEHSESFWGDVCKRQIDYIRNYTFYDINTLKADKLMPYRTPGKEKYSNYWFSSSDGIDADAFARLVNEKSIDRLAREKGACIVYTHFAYGFVKDGRLDERFTRAVDYLSQKNGFFAPASTVLDVIREARGDQKQISRHSEAMYDLKWFFMRTMNEMEKKMRRV